MFKAETHDLLSLFATMVLADKKVYAVEVEAFSTSVIEFFIKTDLSPVPTQEQLFEWFEANRETIKLKHTQADFEMWFEALMQRVDQVYSIKAVVEVMETIALSDGELHISEKALMVLVDKYWLRAA